MPVLQRVVALEIDTEAFPPFLLRLACGHLTAVAREHVPPDALAPPTEVRCPTCEFLRGEPLPIAMADRPLIKL